MHHTEPSPTGRDKRISVNRNTVSGDPIVTNRDTSKIEEPEESEMVRLDTAWDFATGIVSSCGNWITPVPYGASKTSYQDGKQVFRGGLRDKRVVSMFRRSRNSVLELYGTYG